MCEGKLGKGRGGREEERLSCRSVGREEGYRMEERKCKD